MKAGSGFAMTRPFHLSFSVPDLAATKRFYSAVLGCQLGRDAGAWVDVNFFGHQLTLHEERAGLPAVAIDHFGPFLRRERWEEIVRRLRAADIAFEVEPFVRDAGGPDEVGKFIVRDPAGNRLEFKYGEGFERTVADADS